MIHPLLLRLVAGLMALGLVTPSTAGGQTPDGMPRYTVDLLVHPDAHVIEMAVGIELPGGAVRRFLLGPSYTLVTIRADGATVDTSVSTAPIPNLRLITVRPDGTGPVRVSLGYQGPLFELVSPSLNVVGPDLVELSVDSFWLPYQADLGAPFEVDATVRGLPANAVAVANLPVSVDGDRLRIRSGPAGTADLALIAAPGLRETRAGRFRMLSADPSAPLAAYYRRHGAAAIGFLEQLLGPMPGGEATITVAKRASGRGYARPGYVVVTDVPGTSPGPGQAKFVTHEFAHLWFSRASLTGEDYWLVEGPAEYLGLRYVRDSLGPDAVAPMLASIRATAAKAPPVLGHGRAPDAALYAKCPALLFALEERIGRSRMDSLLARLAALPRHTTALFLEQLAQVAGAGVASDFEADLRRE
ncbi:MAG: hypothetical protein AB7L66_21550 [Gemmatimonadales bacterium]